MQDQNENQNGEDENVTTTDVSIIEDDAGKLPENLKDAIVHIDITAPADLEIKVTRTDT